MSDARMRRTRWAVPTGAGGLAAVATGAVLALVLSLAPATAGVGVRTGAGPVPTGAIAGLAAADTGGESARATDFTPKTGATFSDPRNKTSHRVVAKIRKSIEAVKHGQQIYVMTWNFRSRGFVKALLDANRRGVTVRLLASKEKVDEQPKGNGDYWVLRRGLRNLSESHPQAKGEHSWARACSRSCRGQRGIAHSKYYLFSQAGRAENVVMSTSANMTDVAANAQWNDMQTIAGNATLYGKFVKIFEASARDQPVTKQFQQLDLDTVSAYFYPWKGSNARGDRVLNELAKVTCKGAKGAGIDGRTVIRVAQDAIIDQRGIDIAQRIRGLWQQGCNIRIVYSLMGNQVRKILKHTTRGPVPFKPILADFDADGVYDRYLHSKVMTVSGNFGGDPGAKVVWQGSENWSGLAKLSDEQGLILRRPRALKEYNGWMNYLWTHAPPPPPKPINSTPEGFAARGQDAQAIDPYAIVKANLG